MGEKKGKEKRKACEWGIGLRRRDRAEVLGLRTIKQRILYNDYATIIFNVPLGGNGICDGSRATAKLIVLEFSHIFTPGVGEHGVEIPRAYPGI